MLECLIIGALRAASQFQSARPANNANRNVVGMLGK
jgi:hypothetical protein